MSAPTRSHIEAVITQPTYAVAYHTGSTWVDVSPSDIATITPHHQASDDLHGLAFGVSVGAGCTITLADTPTIRALAWEQLQVRVAFGFGSSTQLVAFVGVIVQMQRDGATITWTCEGLDTLMRGIPVYSPMFYQRRIATTTSATSVDDPSNLASRAGMINYLLWRCGGRPLEQQATYPSALFYYTCQDALIAPVWTWVSGENVWDELQRLCKVGGGQLAQRADGVLAYVNPLAFGTMPSTPYTFSSAVVGGMQVTAQARDTIASVRGRVSVRQLQPEGIVYEDTIPRLIAASTQLDIACDLERPVYDYVYAAGNAPALPSSSSVITTIHGEPASPAQVAVQLASIATGGETGAGRATVRITHLSGPPMILSRLALRGRAVAVVAEEQVTVGSGTPQLEIGSDLEPLIQSRAHFEALASLYVTVYGVARPVITLTGCGYDPDRWVGERCLLHLPDLGYTQEPVMIVALRVQDGATMDVDVVSVAGLPTSDAFFVVDQTYVAGSTRQMGY